MSPALQHVLPKPGVWMVTLKQVLAFPLYATSAWLVWVLSIQAGSDGVMAAALAVVGSRVCGMARAQDRFLFPSCQIDRANACGGCLSRDVADG